MFRRYFINDEEAEWLEDHSEINRIISIHRDELYIGKSKSYFLRKLNFSMAVIIIGALIIFIIQYLTLSSESSLQIPIILIFVAILDIGFLIYLRNQLYELIQKRNSVYKASEQINVYQMSDQFFLTIFNFIGAFFEVVCFDIPKGSDYLKLHKIYDIVSLYYSNYNINELLIQGRKDGIIMVERVYNEITSKNIVKK